MRIVVTGGGGDVGGRVVHELRQRGHEVVPASRRTGVDLRTGAGLEQALAGAEAVVHAATDTRRPQGVDVAGIRRVAEVVSRQGSPAHVVCISIVGCDRVPLAYYRAKRDAEVVLQTSGVPATVVRATQFHSVAAFMAKLLRLGPLAFSIGDLRIQPVDIDWVAARLADHVEGPAPTGFTRATDLAGPDLFSLADLGGLVARHEGRSAAHVLRVPPVGGVMRAYSRGAILPGRDLEVGGRTFEMWLAGQPRPLPRDRHDRT